MKCFYHSRDLDGYCSGAIIKKKFPGAELIGFDYGEEFPFNTIREGEEVIMIDVSLPMDQMERLAKICKGSFTWIDHHKSAIKDYEEACDLPFPEDLGINAVLEDGMAACEGAWMHFFTNEPMPKAVELLGAYDTWRQDDKMLDWENSILPFQYGMRVICNSPESFNMDLLKPKAEIHVIINNGNAIIEYQKMENEKNCNKNAFETTFDGLRAICVNGGPFNSMTFDSVWNPEKHDVMMPFQYNGKFWTVSLYSTHDHIDCSEIAKKHGGGGHKGAAGFQYETPDLTFFPELF